jgi:hypothetical protein
MSKYIDRQIEMLKGDDPWGPNRKKETLYEKLKYFCSQYHWDKSTLISSALDENSDGYLTPTLPLFLYNCYRRIRGWDPVYAMRMSLQRIFRSNHLADCDIWEAGYTIAKQSLKIVKAFKDYDRHGIPSIFSEYHENEWKSKEEYDKAIADGKMLGGGQDAWEKVLDHIIMALEYKANEGNKAKLEEEWWIKYFGMNPYDESNRCNKYEKYEFRYKDDNKNIGCHMTFDSPPEDPERCEYIKKEICYGNSELVRYAEELVQEGFELFGKYCTAMWD